LPEKVRTAEEATMRTTEEVLKRLRFSGPGLSIAMVNERNPDFSRVISARFDIVTIQ